MKFGKLEIEEFVIYAVLVFVFMIMLIICHIYEVKYTEQTKQVQIEHNEQISDKQSN